MKHREPISTIMTKDLFTVEVGDSLRDVKQIFKKNKVRHVPVVKDKKLVGIISRSAIMRLNYGNPFGNVDDAEESVFDVLKIEQVMAEHPTTITPDTPIADVAEMLTVEELHALPVVEDGNLVGIVTTTDVIKYLLCRY